MSCFKYLIHHQYKDNWGRNLRELFQFEHLPKGIEHRLQTMVTSENIDEIIELSTDHVDSIRKLLIDMLKGKPEDRIEYNFLEEDEATTISYASKIKKGASENDIFSVAYAHHDMINGLKHDLMKKAGLWDKSSALKLPSERNNDNIYKIQNWPDFQSAISKVDFDNLELMADDVLDRLYDGTNLPNFIEFEEMVKYVRKQVQHLT